jgi:CheY-like chemotaxis protein
MTPDQTTRMQEPRADHQTRRATIRPVHGPPLVLVVDDFPVLRCLMGRFLTHLGFAIVGAGSAGEALGILRTHTPTHAILDVHFPGGSRVVYDTIRSRPDNLHQRTAFMTGGFTDPILRDFVESSGCPTIFKPFEMAQIRAFLGAVPSASGHTVQPGPTLSTISTSRG